MTLPFKRYTTCISMLMLLLLNSSTTLACGPSLYYDESRFALFRPGIDGQSGLEPFYYSERFLNSNVPDPAGLDYLRNCREWQVITGSQVAIKDIYEVQYKTNPDDFAFGLQTGDWKGLEDNSFIAWLKRPANQEAMAYMALAKESEHAQFYAGDPWDNAGSEGMNFDLMQQVSDKAAALRSTTGNAFLRERYAFQYLKTLYYLDHDTDSIAYVYKKYLARSRSVVKGWAELYYGMSLNGIARTRMLLQSFHHSEEKKVFCYNRISLADLDRLERSRPDKQALVLIYTLRAMHKPGQALTLIRKVHALSPSSPYLSFLVGREVNKLEDWIWSPEALQFYENPRQDAFYEQHPDLNRWQIDAHYYYRKNRNKDLAYLSELKQLLRQLQRGRQRDFYRLSEAHLDNIGRNYTSAYAILNAMGKLNNKAMETQRLIDLTLATAYTRNVRDAGTKQQIARHIAALQRLNPSFTKRNDTTIDSRAWNEEPLLAEGDEERGDDLSELLLMLSMRYQDQGDRVTAGLLYNKANLTTNNYDGSDYYYLLDTPATFGYKNIAWYDRNATPLDIDRLLVFKQKGPQTAFERMITPLAWAPRDFYLDLKGTILMRQKHYREAQQVFGRIAPDFWQNNYEYKSYLPAKDIRHLGGFSPWDTTTARPYGTNSKKLIVDDIVSLMDNIAKEKNREHLAAMYYRMGNAQYSLTYHGKAWMMISYGNSDNENWIKTGDWSRFTFYPNSRAYGKDYYECATAIAWYKKALQLTRDKEKKAGLLLMLAACDRDAGAVLSKRSGKYGTNEFISPYLKRVSKDYSETATYASAYGICPDLP